MQEVSSQLDGVLIFGGPREKHFFSNTFFLFIIGFYAQYMTLLLKPSQRFLLCVLEFGWILAASNLPSEILVVILTSQTKANQLILILTVDFIAISFAITLRTVTVVSH